MAIKNMFLRSLSVAFSTIQSISWNCVGGNRLLSGSSKKTSAWSVLKKCRASFLKSLARALQTNYQVHPAQTDISFIERPEIPYYQMSHAYAITNDCSQFVEKIQIFVNNRMDLAFYNVFTRLIAIYSQQFAAR